MPDKTLKIRIKLKPAQTSTMMSDSPLESLTKERRNSARAGNSKRKLVAAAFTGLFVILITTYLIRSNDVGEHPPTKLTQNTLDLSYTTKSVAQIKPDTQTIAALETAPIPKPRNTIDQSSPDPKAPIETALHSSAEILQPEKSEELYQEIPLQSQLSVLESSVPGSINQNVKDPSANISAEIKSTMATDDTSDPTTIVLVQKPEFATESLGPEHHEAIAQPLLPPNIVRAQLTNGIKNREPIDRADNIISTSNQEFKRLFYFTEFRNMKGQKIIHRWEHEGRIEAEIKFNVDGNRWRVYSSKNLIPSMEGEWKIIITNATGKVLLTDGFVYN